MERIDVAGTCRLTCDERVVTAGLSMLIRCRCRPNDANGCGQSGSRYRDAIGLVRDGIEAANDTSVDKTTRETDNRDGSHLRPPCGCRGLVAGEFP